MKYKFRINSGGKATRYQIVGFTLPVKPRDGQTISVTRRYQAQPEDYMYWGNQWYRV